MIESITVKGYQPDDVITITYNTFLNSMRDSVIQGGEVERVNIASRIDTLRQAAEEQGESLNFIRGLQVALNTITVGGNEVIWGEAE
jgi:hypothetical protein